MEETFALKLGAGDWLRLERTDGCYALTAGEVELYAVQKAAGRESARRYICSARAGDYLFAAAGEEIAVLAIATASGQAAFLPWESFVDDAALAGPCEAYARFALQFPEACPRPQVFQDVAPGEALEAAAGAHIKLRGKDARAVLWLQVERGALRLQRGGEIAAAGDFLPLSPQEAAVAEADAALRAYDTKGFLARCPRERALALLARRGARLAADYAAYFARREAFYAQRLAEQRQEKELLVANSYAELLRNLIPELPVVVRPQDKTQPPVVHALRQIAAFFGLRSDKIRLPPGWEKTAPQPRDAVRLLSRTSNLHGRRVLLEPGWQTKDQGPLLVFRGQTPLAALPKSPSAYELVDLEAGARILIDARVAEQLDMQAYVFFQSMPESVQSVSQWLRWAAGLCWRQDFWLLLFASLIVGFIPVVTPLITQTVFEDIVPSFDKQAHLMVVQVMFVTSIAGALTSLVRGITVLRMKNHIRVAAESALWLKLLALPASFFRRYQIGDLTQRMQSVSQLSGQFSSVVSAGLFNGVFCFWNLIVMFYFSLKLSFLALVLWGAYILLSAFFSWRLARGQRRKAEASGEVSSQTLQLLSGLSKFRLRAAEERAFYLWARKFGDAWRWTRFLRWQGLWLDLVGQSRALTINFFLFWVTMNLFDASLEQGVEFLSQANFLSFNAALGSFGASVSGLLGAANGLMAAYPSLERAQPILAARPERSERKSPAGELSGALEATNLSFRYKPDAPLALKNISFRVAPGMFLAVVGASGSGKSTLLRLLIGLEKPEKGAVQYDGQDLADLDVASVRGQIGVVMQHGRLMSGSIFSNIVGSLPLTLDDAWEAAKLVGLDGDIKEMPMGMHTVISEGAGNISGGQRQRILIARSIVARPRLIVFDEATSALDNETQAIVSGTLERMKATRIVVAHRLSTIERADAILVLDRGEIAEYGTYEQLLQKDGIFAALAKRQMA